jgi:hypothetical protein
MIIAANSLGIYVTDINSNLDLILDEKIA